MSERLIVPTILLFHDSLQGLTPYSEVLNSKVREGYTVRGVDDQIVHIR